MPRFEVPVTGEWEPASSGPNNLAPPAGSSRPGGVHRWLDDDVGQSRRIVIPGALSLLSGIGDPWRQFEGRVRLGPYALTGFPARPHSPIQVLYLADGVAERVNAHPNLFHILRDQPPRGRGQWPAADQGRADPGPSNELKKVMSQMRNQVFNPTYPRRRAWKRGLFTGQSSHPNEEEDTDDDDGTECTVCLEAFLPNEQVLVTPCNHMFHHDCLVPWVQNQGKCPLCRFVFRENRTAAMGGMGRQR